jgi:hypothetical protein
VAQHSGPCLHAEIAVRLGCQIARQFPPSCCSTSRPGESWREASFFAAYGGPKRSPSLNFTRVRRADVVEGPSCYLPMRFVSIGKPLVHHERISVVGAFDPIRARLWFRSHRDKSHFPNDPVVAKNLRLEGISAFRSDPRRRRIIAPGDLIEGRWIRSAHIQSLPPASPSGQKRAGGVPGIMGAPAGASLAVG